jgi:ABC-type sugar transport system ATPase subunit
VDDRGDHLRISGIARRYGGLQALDGVSFVVARGEIHAIVGENGAGKSTLMKILAGVETADAGSIAIAGQDVSLTSPAAARAAGIAIVFQELNLFPHLSVAANIFAGRERARTGGFLDEAAMREASREALEALGVAIDPRTRVAELSAGERQLVEIARAVACRPAILILDEPNSALDEGESRRLFEVLRRLRSAGVTVLYISHRLEEVFAIADRISVLRDGRYQGTWRVADTTIHDTVRAMTGRSFDEVFPARGPVSGNAPMLLEARDLACAPRLERLSLRLRAGEILGIAGIEGSGVEEIFEVLFGMRRPTAGEMRCLGEPGAPRSPAEALRRGVGLIPRSRREEGLFLAWPVRKNATILVLRRLRSWLGLLGGRRERRRTDELLERFHVVTDSREKRIGLLSGGNQQKVVIAKWLAAQPRILLLHDPTRGIDIGAKAEVYKLCCDLAAQGLGLIFTSSEIEETLGLCDRVLVLYKGKMVRDVGREGAAPLEVSKAEVLQAMTSG